MVLPVEEVLFKARLNASALVGPELCGSRDGLLLEEGIVEMLALLEDIEVDPAELAILLLLADRAAAAAATAALFAWACCWAATIAATVGFRPEMPDSPGKLTAAAAARR